MQDTRGAGVAGDDLPSTRASCSTRRLVRDASPWVTSPAPLRKGDEPKATDEPKHTADPRSVTDSNHPEKLAGHDVMRKRRRREAPQGPSPCFGPLQLPVLRPPRRSRDGVGDQWLRCERCAGAEAGKHWMSGWLETSLTWSTAPTSLLHRLPLPTALLPP